MVEAWLNVHAIFIVFLSPCVSFFKIAFFDVVQPLNSDCSGTSQYGQISLHVMQSFSHTKTERFKRQMQTNISFRLKKILSSLHFVIRHANGQSRTFDVSTNP